VALGTDSRASNGRLSMLGELAAAAQLWPGLSPDEILAMATEHGGAALGRRGLGRLRRGGRADFLAVGAIGDRPERELEEFLHGRRQLLGTWVAGRRHAPPC
jgi:cytosine/adenosine deaminase-related metal-dependent hydrolase